MDRFPGKVFLLGEYAILKGEPAWLAAVDLPTGYPMYGWGSSSKSWVLQNPTENTLGLWRKARTDSPKQSHADLIAQKEAYEGRGNLFEIQISVDSIQQDVSWSALDANRLGFGSLHLFSVAHDLEKKRVTSTDLDSVWKDPGRLNNVPSVLPYLQSWKNRKDLDDWAFLSLWADACHQAGLESVEAHERRKMAESFPGVVAAKGCGAGLNDVLLVAFEQNSSPNFLKLADGLCAIYVGCLQDRMWRAA